MNRVVFGSANNTYGNLYVRLLMPSTMRMHTRDYFYKLDPHYILPYIDAQAFSFSDRVIHLWNNLPASDEHFKSQAAFNTFIRGVNLIPFVVLNS